MTVKNAFYAQSGGVTAVINTTACGLIQEARQHPEKNRERFAGRDGIIGALTEDLIDTSLESDEDIARLRTRRVAPSVPAATNSKAWKSIAPNTSA
jgi:6-phosphofructokinase